MCFMGQIKKGVLEAPSPAPQVGHRPRLFAICTVAICRNPSFKEKDLWVITSSRVSAFFWQKRVLEVFPGNGNSYKTFLFQKPVPSNTWFFVEGLKQKKNKKTVCLFISNQKITNNISRCSTRSLSNVFKWSTFKDNYLFNFEFKLECWNVLGNLLSPEKRFLPSWWF